ncbi:MAG TPA: farnesyl diphosphate synthase [Pyrinomonadaceae bacterium]|nr:farnesyl diphosphate synthase [Pyrinomonadaceae bacterium]
MPDLQSFFSEVSSLVNSELDWLIPEVGQPPRSLRDSIRWSLFAPGKNFRSALVFAVGRVFDAKDEQLVRTGAAVEMIHTYSLIHDDLPSMDDADLRRGREACHRKFGESTAILAGDALQVLAFKAIAEDERLAKELRLTLMSALAKAAVQMVVGQQLDLEAEGRSVTIDELEWIHRNKTGALIGFSAEAGAVIGGASDTEFTAISNFAERLGLLFQITDDLLDVTQTTEELGKTAGKDSEANKATYPAVFGIERAEQLAKDVHAEVVSSVAALGDRAALLVETADAILTRRS